MNRLLLVVALLLAGCTRDVKVVDDKGAVSTIAIPVSTVTDTVVYDVYFQPTVTVQVDRCHHAGYCYTCGLKFSGKYECGFGFFYRCPGHQQVEHTRQPFLYFERYHLDSGIRRSPAYRGVRDTTRELSPCR